MPNFNSQGIQYIRACDSDIEIIMEGFQDTGAIPELGKLRYTKGIDPEVDEILAFYRRTIV